MDRNNDEAHLYHLQYALRTERDALNQPSYGTVSFPTRQTWDNPAPDVTPNAWDLDEELAHMLSAATTGPEADTVPLQRPQRRTNRRRQRPESHFLDGGQRITHVTILIAAIAVCAASMLAWSITYSYGQLRTIAESVLPAGLAQWWPLTVYGPWFVAALSILRATVQRRSAHRSWGVILAASFMAVALCVSHSSRSLLAFVMLGIPPITALVCFWELIGQVSSKYRTRQQAPQGAHAHRSSKT
ncbi:DUF2637 domain-containing protein [Streptomyces brasiliensis]|uniref:DUF2637 domain-containing protein n=1 Tax=Streptomyces brasiliensis TaxID=1954 RepID=A0A917KIN2_9ACTN|nr:DUF2637 domain-containing protein [Streptomyces brasiliensis]GGJ13845.1 hypothetical protein GCM10010121_025540 [Streptomyces brasiliensis]